MLTVDRFDDSYAVCEDSETENMIYIKRELLPDNIKEGDILRETAGVYEIDACETEKAREETADLFDALFSEKQ